MDVPWKLRFYSHLHPFPRLGVEELEPSRRWSGGRLVMYRHQYEVSLLAETSGAARAIVLELDPMAEFSHGEDL